MCFSYMHILCFIKDVGILGMRVCLFSIVRLSATNGNWYYMLALDSMRAKLRFRCRSVNIGPSYTQ